MLKASKFNLKKFTLDKAVNPLSLKLEHPDDSNIHNSWHSLPNAIREKSVKCLQFDIQRCFSSRQLFAIETIPSSVIF